MTPFSLARLMVWRGSRQPGRQRTPLRSRVRATAPPAEKSRRSWLATAPGLILAAIVLGWLAASAWLLVGGATEDDRLLIADVLPPVLDLGAAMLILHAARGATTRRAAAAWASIGLATIVYAAGDGLYAWFELGLQAVPFPSLADVAYVAYYVIVVAALLSFPTAPANRAERARLAIDSAIVVIGGGMLIWQAVFRTTLDSLGGDPIATLLSVGYPAGDLMILFGVAAVALRRPAGVDGRALVALVGGLFIVLFADIGYAQSNLEGGEAWQNWPDVLYMASTATIALAGFLQARSRSVPDGERDETAIPRPLLYLPYLSLTAGYGTLLTTTGFAAEHVELTLGAVVLTVMVLARQELVLRQNSALQAEQARRESEARFRSLAGNASDAIALVDPAGIVADATDSVRRVLGLEAAALIGRSIVRLAHAEDTQRLSGLIDDAVARRPSEPLEWRLWDGNGTWRQVETIAANLIDDPTIGHIVLTTRDVRERKALEQRLSQVALHDVLTGLPNRALFLDRIDHALANGLRRGHGMVVLAINVDAFKRVNDSLGHPAGDRLLQELSGRLAGSLRAADTCARLGGDVFGVLLEGTSATSDGLAAAARIQAALHEPYVLQQAGVRITVRIGLAIADPATDGPAALVRNASVAMAHAREDGRKGVALFEPEMRQEQDGRFELEADLRGAIERNELALHYQPIHDLTTGEIVAAEARLGWNHPILGRLAPSVFVPLAEETGLIEQLGNWLLRTASTEVAGWARISHSRVPRVSVNLLPAQVADPSLPWTIQAAIGQAGAVPAWISLEVAEGLLMENTAAVLERLHAIRSLGVSIALDEFGMGFSSLSNLQRSPMSHLKIDRSFVAPLDDPTSDQGVVRAVVEIGRSLGMMTIADGIETTTQLNKLRELGCALGQGSLLNVPLEAEAIRELVANPVTPFWAAAATHTPRGRRGSRAAA